MAKLLRAAGALAVFLLLSACLVTPGKFVSTLDIRADRSFTFTYKGEVIASDMGPGSQAAQTGVEDQSFEHVPEGDEGGILSALLWQDGKPGGAATNEQRFDAADTVDPRKTQAVAAALTK